MNYVDGIPEDIEPSAPLLSPFSSPFASPARDDAVDALPDSRGIRLSWSSYGAILLWVPVFIFVFMYDEDSIFAVPVLIAPVLFLIQNWRDSILSGSLSANKIISAFTIGAFIAFPFFLSFEIAFYEYFVEKWFTPMLEEKIMSAHWVLLISVATSVCIIAFVKESLKFIIGFFFKIVEGTPSLDTFKSIVVYTLAGALGFSVLDGLKVFLRYDFQYTFGLLEFIYIFVCLLENTLINASTSIYLGLSMANSIFSHSDVGVDALLIPVLVRFLFDFLFQVQNMESMYFAEPSMYISRLASFLWVMYFVRKIEFKYQRCKEKAFMIFYYYQDRFA